MSELTLTERAKQALTIEHTEKELQKMAASSKDITEIKDKTDYQLVKSRRIDLKAVRVSIQKAGKAARDDATRFSKAVIAEEKRLIAYIEPEEKRLQVMQKHEDEREEREAEERRQAEQARIQRLNDRISEIANLAEGLLGADAAFIDTRRDILVKTVIDDSWEEYADAARKVVEVTSHKLDKAYTERVAFEAQQAELARQQEEQRKRDEEQAEREAELRRQEEEIRKERERIETEKRAEEERKLAEERAEAERIRQEKERLEQEQREREEAEQRAAAEEAERARQEALRPEKERLTDWVNKLRFIDGVELKDKDLIKIQKLCLAELAQLSERFRVMVEDA